MSTGYLYYNCEGKLIEVDYQKESYECCSRFFRKFCDDDIETIICRKLVENPHPNCVTIYNVDGCIVDMELLDTNKKLEHSHLVDIRNAVEHLNSLGVVYIDLKPDNIGFSQKDSVYKLFDFNMSGIVKTDKNNEWLVKPRFGYILRNVYEYLGDPENYNLFTIDAIAMDRYIKKELSW